jgi:N-carbamoyl-L-amino-acid hydrolase
MTENRMKFVQLFETIRVRSADGPGVTRASYSNAETMALHLVEQTARELGLRSEYDAAGNLWVSTAHADRGAPYVLCGSHVDSVAQGGNYDGLAGVIAGLAALARLPVDVPVRLVALRGEEGAWYGRCYKGSQAIFGEPGDDALRRVIAEAGTRAVQWSHEALKTALATLGKPLVDLKQIRAFLELHIEQGPVLVAKGLPLGIVTSIRGNVRCRVRCLGEAAHSGATPRHMRKDAVMATAALLTALDDWCGLQASLDNDAVITAGVLHTNSATNAVTRIPEETTFSLECRSVQPAVLSLFQDRLRGLIEELGTRRGVTFQVDEEVTTPPAVMDEGVTAVLLETARALGRQHLRLPSGAGHDAAVFAWNGIPTGMIFVRNANGSHNPAEAMDMADFWLGVDVLHGALVRLATRTE